MTAALYVLAPHLACQPVQQAAQITQVAVRVLYEGITTGTAKLQTVTLAGSLGELSVGIDLMTCKLNITAANFTATSVPHW